MDLTRDFLTKIEEMAKPEIIEIEGKKFSEKNFFEIDKKADPAQLTVSTLTGLIEYLQKNKDSLDLEKVLIHVVEPRQVRVYTALNSSNKRPLYLVSDCSSLGQFHFGQYADQEKFIIDLMTLFQPTEDLNTILRVVSNLSDEMVQRSKDDGISQTVVLKAGIVQKANETIINPVVLRPFRSFREIDQVESQFIFRLKGGGEGQKPQCALFEANGESWKLSAMKEIKSLIEKNVKGVAVIA